MTIVLTISTPEGILLSADRRITILENGIIKSHSEEEKILFLEEPKIGISWWGLIEKNGKRLFNVREIEKIVKKKYGFVDVNNFADEITKHLLNSTINERMGIHIAGYIEGIPNIRHIFHEKWHHENDVTNEHSNKEKHYPHYERSYPYKIEHPYMKHMALFNGDNVILSNMINDLEFFHGAEYGIDFDNLPLEKAKELAKILISLTIKMQDFLLGYEKLRTCGNGIDILIIKKDGTFEKYETIRKFQIDV